MFLIMYFSLFNKKNSPQYILIKGHQSMLELQFYTFLNFSAISTLKTCGNQTQTALTACE